MPMRHPTSASVFSLLRKWGNISNIHSDLGIKRMLSPGKELELQCIHSISFPCFPGVVSGRRPEGGRTPAVRRKKVTFAAEAAEESVLQRAGKP